MAIGPDYSVRPYADKYARDETPVSESDLRSIQKMADNVDSKKWGIDTRYSISSSMRLMDEVIKDTLGRQDEVEDQFQDVIENTTDKDVISAPEIIAARNGEANLKARLDKEQQEVAAQLAQTGISILKYPREINETNASWINRVVNILNNKGIKNLRLEKEKKYIISETIFIPEGFKLNLNNSRLMIYDNIDILICETLTDVYNGNVEIFNDDFNRVALQWSGANIRYGNYWNLLIKGAYGGNLGGIGILMNGDTPSSFFTYLRFTNCQVRLFETGLKMVITDEVRPDGRGAWINANTFDGLRISECRNFIDMDGTGWGIDGAQREISGNIFTRLELQLSEVVKIALRVTGNGNHFSGHVWDGSDVLSENKIIICNEKAQQNVFDFPYLHHSKNDIDTERNTLLYYNKSYGVPTAYDRFGIPHGVNYPTFIGNQDDYLAYADKRFNINFINKTPFETNYMFRPHGLSTFWRGLEQNEHVGFEISFDNVNTRRLQRLGVLFDRTVPPPKSFKVTAFYSDDESRVLDHIQKPKHVNIIENNLEKRLVKLVFEFEANNSNGVNISRIFGMESELGGQTYITKEGGVLYNSIEFSDSNRGIIVKSPNNERYRITVNDNGEVIAVKQ